MAEFFQHIYHALRGRNPNTEASFQRWMEWHNRRMQKIDLRIQKREDQIYGIDRNEHNTPTERFFDRLGGIDREKLNREQKRRNQFAELRRDVLLQVSREELARIQTNPVPTETEINIGTFVEALEPQVRDAVVTFYQKGYNTECSGFFDYGTSQGMQGNFDFDAQTVGQLEAKGVKLSFRYSRYPDVPPAGSLYFEPAEPDLAAIKSQWDDIAAILPQSQRPYLPASTSGAYDFRKQYAPERVQMDMWRRELIAKYS